MPIRTDLAIDLSEDLREQADGIEKSEKINGDIKITEIRVTSEQGEKFLGRKIGTYITLEFPEVMKITDYGNLKAGIIDVLNEILPDRENILVVGLGNCEITPDAVGPVTARHILATRHISGQFAEEIGLRGLKSVSVMAPGVLGQTGIEVLELIKGTAEAVKPSAVIVIDALASKSVGRLFKTVQICNTGISPGSGVKNSRNEISYETLGIPVIAVGVPTVVDASVLAYELTGKETEINTDMFVTPKEVDLLTDRISEIISSALNIFLQPDIEEDIILSLV